MGLCHYLIDHRRQLAYELGKLLSGHDVVAALDRALVRAAYLTDYLAKLQEAGQMSRHISPERLVEDIEGTIGLDDLAAVDDGSDEAMEAVAHYMLVGTAYEDKAGVGLMLADRPLDAQTSGSVAPNKFQDGDAPPEAGRHEDHWIDVNDTVRLKLTDRGRAMVRERVAKLNQWRVAYGAGPRHVFQGPAVSPDGWVQGQFHALMEYFSEAWDTTSLGCEVPFTGLHRVRPTPKAKAPEAGRAGPL